MASKRDPEVDEEFLKALYRGGELLSEGNLQGALPFLERAHALNQRNEKAQNLLGLCNFKLGHFERASQVYELLVRENPVDATLRVNLGLVYLKTNQLELSIREFEAATDLDSDHKKAHNYLGLALAQKGDYGLAKTHFVLAGSDAMVEKMERALEARAEPRQPPLTAPAVTPAMHPPSTQHRTQYSAIENQKPEPSPSQNQIASDWATQLNPPAPSDDIRFAEDEGPPALNPTPSALHLKTEAVDNQDGPAPQSSEVLPVLDETAVEVEVPLGDSSDFEQSVVVDPSLYPPRDALQHSDSTVQTSDVLATQNTDDGRYDSAAAYESDPYLQPTQTMSDEQIQAKHWQGKILGASVAETEMAVEAWGPSSQAFAEFVDETVETGSDPLQGWAESGAPEKTGTLAFSLLSTDPENASSQRTTLPHVMAELSAESQELGFETGEMGVQNRSFAVPTSEAKLNQVQVQNTLPQSSSVSGLSVQPTNLSAEGSRYAPMLMRRLADLGNAMQWVQKPEDGPFHLSSDGLAVTVAGEMLARMVGLVAVVGSVKATPENKRRRGRASREPFGLGPWQLQRVSGHGVLYLEPGKSRFHAIDLVDQDGPSFDDDGAFLREDMVFAFEEPLTFENGKLVHEATTLDLVHLKGQGRVLLQLEGELRAMPVPAGTPMVIPLVRLVGWFGHLTPRIVGFSGHGAIELTGEGYALLGAPAERV
jgi:hypothetical protein